MVDLIRTKRGPKHKLYRCVLASVYLTLCKITAYERAISSAMTSFNDLDRLKQGVSFGVYVCSCFSVALSWGVRNCSRIVEPEMRLARRITVSSFKCAKGMTQPTGPAQGVSTERHGVLSMAQNGNDRLGMK